MPTMSSAHCEGRNFLGGMHAYTTLHYTTPLYIILHYITLHCVTLPYIAFHHITPHPITSHPITSHTSNLLIIFTFDLFAQGVNKDNYLHRSIKKNKHMEVIEV